MESLQLEISEQAGALVMKLAGQMTYAEMDAFDKYSDRLSTSKPSLVILDFSELSIMTSAGIGALLRLERRMREMNCAVRIAAPQPKIEEIFRLSRLDQIFKIMPSVVEAMN